MIATQPDQRIADYLARHQVVIDSVTKDVAPLFGHVAELMCAALRNQGKILLCGNGGSAADAQHFAAELVGRFRRDRQALAAIALTTDSSALTAIGNDFGFDQIFSRQVEALAAKADVLVAISTSGNSSNVLQAVRTAREQGCLTVGLLGRNGGSMAAEVDVALVVPAEQTSHVQEAHIVIIHLLCELVESAFSAPEE